MVKMRAIQVNNYLSSVSILAPYSIRRDKQSTLSFKIASSTGDPTYPLITSLAFQYSILLIIIFCAFVVIISFKYITINNNN